MKINWFLILIVILAAACQSPGESDPQITWNEFYETELFREIQMAALFPDSKSFTDAVPRKPLAEIIRNYEESRSKDDFDLKVFVLDNFDMPSSVLSTFKSDTTLAMKAHIINLWDELTRKADEVSDLSSLVPLPHAYVVPGGRFREIYYWDSFFTMEGLMVSGREDLVENMVRNFAYLIDTIGFIPNGNRAYYLGRSQPPFFAPMVDLLASKDRDLYVSFLPQLQKEYDFWMDGASELSENNQAVNRTVRLSDGSILNRYWDNFALPRPESYREDVIVVRDMLVPNAETSDAVTKYRHLRAGAESGWEFSSRWFADGENLETIHTTDIIPVDLNSLLYFLEMKLAQGYDWKGQRDQANEYLNRAMTRKAAIQKYLWDDSTGMYVDFDFVNERPTSILSLAAAYPLYFKIAEKSQAKKIAAVLEDQFLQGGGFVTTLRETGQQWDWPNGWAPLQWITINGLYNYNFHELGNEGAQRWLDRNREVYEATGKMMEKYNVVDVSLLAGGGEYALQDGFGWTNGVALAMLKIFEEKEMVEEMRGED